MTFATTDPIIACSGLSKVYGRGPLAETVLSGVHWRSAEAKPVCWSVPPALARRPSSQFSVVCSARPPDASRSKDVWSISRLKGRWSSFRRRSIGFIFQRSQLLSFLTVSENLAVVGKNAGLSRLDVEARIASLAAALDIEIALRKRPGELSGGQRQRVGIARAVLHHPVIVLADEPTASLDRANGEAVINLLTARARAEKTSLLTVTHDTRLLNQFDRVYRIENGKLVT